jgi:pilus assembly protein CpaF
VQNGTFSQEAVEFMSASIGQRKNIVISGGTGTGKTTVLNALSAFIPESERIITIEDPIELKLQQRHIVAMEARSANIEGRNAVTQRELVRNALRMRPDRIIVGEVRGQEAFDMMQAMNTGHEGSMTTVHANSERDALSRIENMVLMAGLDLPIRAIREQMASALHLLVHLSRSSDGRRTVTSISATGGLEGETVVLRELFKLDAAGRLEPVVDGTLR